MLGEYNIRIDNVASTYRIFDVARLGFEEMWRGTVALRRSPARVDVSTTSVNILPQYRPWRVKKRGDALKAGLLALERWS